METDKNSIADRGPSNPAISPEQLKSDIDTIKNVLADSERDREKGPHRVIIAAANLVVGSVFLIVYLVPFVAGMVYGLTKTPYGADAPPAPVLIVGTVVFFAFLVALPFLLAVWGLFKRRRWGTVGALIAAVLNLINIPVGPALAIYTFWAFFAGKLPLLRDGNRVDSLPIAAE